MSSRGGGVEEEALISINSGGSQACIVVLTTALIQLSLLNSFLLYKKDGGRKPLLDFQRSAIASLPFTENTPEIP